MTAFQKFDPNITPPDFLVAEVAKPAKAAKPKGFRHFPPSNAHLKLAKVEGTLGSFSRSLAGENPQKTSALAALGALGGVRNDRRLVTHAVLLQIPADVPEAWAQGIADLLAMPPHPDWPDTAWKTLQNDALAFLNDWAAQAHQLGWSAQDLFSVHADAPYARLDCMGLIPLLRGMPIVALSDTSACMKAFRGTLTYRKRRTWPPDCCLIWELDASS